MGCAHQVHGVVPFSHGARRLALQHLIVESKVDAHVPSSALKVLAFKRHADAVHARLRDERVRAARSERGR